MHQEQGLRPRQPARPGKVAFRKEDAAKDVATKGSKAGLASALLGPTDGGFLMSDNRYSHWFWHGGPLDWIDKSVAALSSWLWHKRFGRYYRNDFWHAVDGRERCDD